MFCPGRQKWVGMFCPGDKNCMGCFVRVTKTAWDVLSGAVNRCGMFCPGCQKMAWDVLVRDVLSYILSAPVTRSRSLQSEVLSKSSFNCSSTLNAKTV